MDSRLFLETLDPAECWTRLTSAWIGRIGITLDALPLILPIFYAVDGRSVVFCTTPDTRLSGATTGAVVAFEVDGYEAEHDEGWSVVLQGVAQEVTAAEHVARLERRDLRAVAGGGSSLRFVAIPGTTISGRRFRGPTASAERFELA